MQISFRLHFTSVDSTQTWVKKNLQQLPQGGVCLISAGSQTAGRGRFPSRKWFSPNEMGVYATFCFFLSPTKEFFSLLGSLGLILAFSATPFLEKNGIFPKIKWPNDLFVGGKKIGGVLVETTPMGDKLAVLAGIGVNLNGTEKMLQEVEKPATSMFLETHRLFSSSVGVKEIEVSFLQNLSLFLEGGFAPFLGSVQNRFYFQPGDRFSVQLSDKKIFGEMRDLLSDGSLQMLVDGKMLSLYSGEIM